MLISNEQRILLFILLQQNRMLGFFFVVIIVGDIKVQCVHVKFKNLFMFNFRLEVAHMTICVMCRLCWERIKCKLFLQVFIIMFLWQIYEVRIYHIVWSFYMCQVYKVIKLAMSNNICIMCMFVSWGSSIGKYPHGSDSNKPPIRLKVGKYIKRETCIRLSRQ
jgi:hypothetical protein